MLKLDSIKADLDKERNGDWVDYPDWADVSFKVKSIEAPDFRAAHSALLNRMARKYKNKTPPQDEIQQEVGKLYHTHILMDWKGLDVAYTADMAKEVLIDPSYRKVFAAIHFCATQVGESDAEFVEDAAKNSVSRSATS